MNPLNRMKPKPDPYARLYGSRRNHEKLQAGRAKVRVEAAIQAVESYAENHNIGKNPDTIEISSLPISRDGKPVEVWSLSNQGLSLAKRLAGALGFGPRYDLLTAKLQYGENGSVKSFDYKVKPRRHDSYNFQSGQLKRYEEGSQNLTEYKALTGSGTTEALRYTGTYQGEEVVSGGGDEFEMITLGGCVNHFDAWGAY